MPLRRCQAGQEPVQRAAQAEDDSRDPVEDTKLDASDGGSRCGRSLAGYELLERIGEGGMGTVYRAHHRLLDKDRAVKVVRRGGFTSTGLEARFLREIHTAGQLDHPHIVSVVDAGEENGELFLVMELLDGCDAAALVWHKGPLPIAVACDIIRQAALGLHHAHEKGYIHRDVKPSNLFVPTGGVVKVLDLGLARLREGVPAARGQPRTVGTVGTPDYMAPEQCLVGHSVDARADLYSLGCSLFHLLTGQPPFAGPGSALVRMRQHCESVPPALRSLRPDAPEELEAIVCRLLEKEPARRFHTAQEVASVLASFADKDLLAEQFPTLVLTAPKQQKARAKAPDRLWKRAITHRGMSGHRKGSWSIRVLLLVVVLPALFLVPWALWGPSKHNTSASEARPLSGKMAVRVWSGKRGVLGQRIGDDNHVVPLRKGDECQVEAWLSEPAYAYLLWIDGKGEVTPLYPWNAGMELVVREVAAVPPARKEDYFRTPPLVGKGWKVDDTEGLDTVLLLARREPWPAGRNLAELFGKVPVAPLRDPGEVVVRGWNRGQPVDVDQQDINRGLEKEAAVIDDQMLQLVERLAGEFEVVRMVRFAHAR
jgi:serine/threonine protein kinase